MIRALCIAVAFELCASAAEAQIRGVYPVGMSATNPGVTPSPGLSYSNLFIFNARDESRGPNGEVVATGANAIMIDLNTFVWVSARQLLGGARPSAAASILISSNSLASDTHGPVSAGGGFGDFYLQPFILGWQKSRVSTRAAYGVLMPTGRFSAGSSNNVGSGYWTHAPSIGVTMFPTESKATSVSVFHMYEVHTVQKGTDINPGDTANIDYSVTHTFTIQPDAQLQLGLIGYGQWQTSDKTGPATSAEQSSARYAVNALGFAASVALPARKVSLGLKYFKEFSTRSTYQGYTLHISGAVAF